jgi:hypothetical protein
MFKRRPAQGTLTGVPLGRPLGRAAIFELIQLNFDLAFRATYFFLFNVRKRVASEGVNRGKEEGRGIRA